MNCVGFKMSINVCLVRSSGQGPSCNNALGSRAALPGRREPKLRWLTCLEEGWQVGQAPRANFCFLWTVNSCWLTLMSQCQQWLRLSWGYLCAAFSALQFLLSPEESPFPLYWNYWDSHVWSREGGGRTRVPTDGHQCINPLHWHVADSLEFTDPFCALFLSDFLLSAAVNAEVVSFPRLNSQQSFCV